MRTLLLLVVMFWPALSFGQTLFLAFDNVPPPWTLKSLRLVHGQVTQAEESLTALPDADCRRLDKAYKAGRTVCAQVACVPESFYTMYVSGKDGKPTNTVNFGTDKACKIRDAEAAYTEALQPEETPLEPAPIPTEAEAAPIPTEAEAAPIPDERDAAPVPIVTPAQPAPVRPPGATPRPTLPTTQPVAVAPPAPAAPPVRPVTTHPQPKPTPAPQPRPTPTTDPGANRIPAPTAAQPWRSGGFAGTQTQTGLDASMQRNGHPTQQLTGHGDYFAQSSTPVIAVEEGRTYDVSAYVKLEEITEFVAIHVFWRDASGASVAWNEAVGSRRKGTQDWAQLQGMATAPPGATTAHIQIRTKSQGGKAWVDDVQMVVRGDRGVQEAAPPPAPDGTPAAPRLPAKPEAPSPLPQPEPAQTRQGLLEQFEGLERDYQAAQAEIRTTYAATVDRLARDRTPAAQQQREQAHVQGTQALQALYQRLLGHWEILAKQWESAS